MIRALRRAPDEIELTGGDSDRPFHLRSRELGD